MAAHFWRFISEQQLSKMVAQGAFMGASAALDRARIIPTQKRRVLELRRGAKPASRR